MFVGVDKGLFKKHGIDLKLKVVNTGTDIVLTSYTEAAQRTHPEYFADLPALPR
jgi:hypothetical protein